jgi:hypothetical protein
LACQADKIIAVRKDIDIFFYYYDYFICILINSINFKINNYVSL